MARPPRLLVADDHPLYRDGVVRTLEDAGRFVVAGVATSADAALEITLDLQPDVVILDISMPGGGLTALERIKLMRPDVRAVMLTASESEADVMRALSLGAQAYVLKGVSGAELVDIISTVAEGGTYVAPSLAAQVLVAMQSGSRGGPRSGIEDLTRREEQILRRVSHGKSNKEVARELELQEKTVKHHMTRILSKLNVRNRVEAAVLARQIWPED